MQIVTVSKASSEDVPHLCDLLHVLFSQETEFLPDRRLQETALVEMLCSPHARIFKAELDGKIVGMVTLQYLISTALGGKVAILEDMIVDEQARGLQVGRKLLEEAVRSAKGEGIRRITLLTDSDNAGAQRFYEKGGFEKSSMLPMRIFISP